MDEMEYKPDGDPKFFGLQPTLINKSVAEQVNDYTMRIYKLIKQTYPWAKGYKASCLEEMGKDGFLHINSNFRIAELPEERKKRIGKEQ